ncbi:late histone H1 [Buttiauxella sp. B2]|uniref:late histone H1 n=1 Tax=Buttiauxella sp. B2 TaxID=2587812 RepID=UPI001CB8D196|nr:late histone H1 [Buttiauxella sp. B2]
MTKLALMLGMYAVMACGAANAANSQTVTNAKAACQANPTQCSQAKANAQKEAQAAKSACAKNQAACDNAKTKARSAAK